jgi:membrane-associated phospholipid phosphatase
MPIAPADNGVPRRRRLGRHRKASLTIVVFPILIAPRHNGGDGSLSDWILDMTQREAVIGWRLSGLCWLVLGAMAAALAISIAVTDFSLAPGGAAFCFGFVAVYAGFSLYNARAAHRRDPQVVFVLGATAQIVLITVLMTPLTYVAAAADYPLRDATLQAIDEALGLDWRGYLVFVNQHPVLAQWLTYGYTMIKWPIFAIPVVLAAAGRYVRLQEFVLAFALALAATTVISAFVPAIGVFHQLGLDPAQYENLQPGGYLEQLRELPLVRDGSRRLLDLLGLAGVVTFPSFHAASALIYGWALWPVRLMRPLAVAANAMMLASTPIDGGHYFIDIVAGLAVAALAIVAARRVSRAVARHAELRRERLIASVQQEASALAALPR